MLEPYVSHFVIVLLALVGAVISLQLVYGVRYAVKTMIEQDTDLRTNDCLVLCFDYFSKVFVKNIVLILIEVLLYFVIFALLRKTEYESTVQIVLALYIWFKFLMTDYIFIDDENITIMGAIAKSFQLMSLAMIGRYLKIFLHFRSEWLPMVLCAFVCVLAVVGGVSILFSEVGYGVVILIVILIAFLVWNNASEAGMYFSVTRFIPFLYMLSACFYIELKAKDGSNIEEQPSQELIEES